MKDREAIMAQIERAAGELRKHGECDRWFADADQLVKGVACDVHGPMLMMLGKQCGYHDTVCVEIFWRGGRLHGFLDRSGCGEPLEVVSDFDPDALFVGIKERNAQACRMHSFHQGVWCCKYFVAGAV